MRHKCLAIFIFTILGLTITTFISLLEFKAFFQPKTLIKVLDQSNVYENLPKLVENLYGQNKSENLQTKVLVLGIIKSIDPKVVQTQVEKNIPPFFSYLNNQTNTLDVTFDLKGFKTTLEKKLPNILSQEMIKLPTCASGIEMSVSENNGLPSCLPQGTTPTQIQQGTQGSSYTDEIMANIPDTYNLRDLKNVDQKLANLKLIFKIINITYWVSIILSLIMIGLLVLLGRSWWPSILRWVGWGLLLPAGSILILNVFSKALPQIFTGQIANGLDPEIVKFINPMIEAINANSMQLSFIYGGILAGIGLVLIILSYALPHPPEPKPPVKQSPSSPTPTTPNPQATPSPTK
ncbi:MAG: hypothetical protein WCV58_04370 [Patescibacteria group bacterium]